MEWGTAAIDEKFWGYLVGKGPKNRARSLLNSATFTIFEANLGNPSVGVFLMSIMCLVFIFEHPAVLVDMCLIICSIKIKGENRPCVKMRFTSVCLTSEPTSERNKKSRLYSRVIQIFEYRETYEEYLLNMKNGCACVYIFT